MRELSRDGDAYRFLFSEVDLAVFLVAEEVEDCNAAACRLLGRARDEIVGRPPREFAPPTQPDGTPSDAGGRERLQSALSGLPQWCKWQFLRADGTPVDTIAHVEAVRLDGARRVLLRVRDVSALERAEVALKETETRLQQILDNTSTAVVFAKDLSGRYLFVNRAFERILGIPQEKIVGRSTDELFQPDVAAELRANDLRVILGRHKIEVEEQVTVRGETRWLLSNKFPLFNRDGEPYAVCGIAADITDRKRTEDAVRKAALAVSGATGKQALQDLVGALCEVLGVDVALVSVFTDPEHTRMQTLAAVLDGKRLRNFDYALADSPCAGLIGRDFRFVDSGARHEMSFDTVFHAKGMDSYAAYALADSAGMPTGLIAVMNRKPMQAAERIEAMLKIFAVRVAAEIERNRAEEALRSAAVAVSGAVGDTVFAELVRALAAILEVEAAFIALPVPEASGRLRMLAFYLDGRMVDEFEYALAGTPCETVIGHGYRVYPSGLGESFPLDEHLRKLGVQSYAGFPLNDARGASIGIISVVSRKPLGNPELAESMLKIFAARAVTEIERKLAEAALRAREEQYRAIFNASADGLALFDAEARVVDANPAFCALFGYLRDELRTMSPKQLVAPESVDVCNQALASAAGGAAFQGECRAMRRDGAIFEIELRGMPMHYMGQPHRLVVVRDITGRKRADEQLRQSEERYRLLFEMESDAILLVDVESLALLDANRAAVELYACSRDELLRMKATDISVEAAETAAAIRGHSGTMRIPLRRHRRKDGTVFPVEISSNLLELGGRKILLAAIRDITERKRAEEKLRESEERYRMLFEMESDAIVVVDIDTQQYLDVNRAAVEMYGYSREELLRLKAADLSAEPEATGEAMRAGSARGGPGVMQVPLRYHRKKDGTLFPVEINASFFDLDGRRVGVAAIRDITERRMREEALRMSEEQYRAIFNASLDGMLIRSPAGEVIDVNPALLAMYGYSREELVGKNPSPVISQENEEEFRTFLGEIGAGRPHRIESRAWRKDGSAFFIDAHGSPVTYRGSPHILSVVRDATERKAGEARLRATVEAALESIIIMNARGDITEFNPAAERCFGLRRVDVLGKPLADVLIPERFRDAHRRGLAHYLETGSSHLVGKRIEVVALRGDGSEFAAELAIATAQESHGRIFVGYLRDITERKRAEEKLRESEERYRLLFEMESDAIVVVDVDTLQHLDVNRAAVELYGYTREELLRLKSTDVSAEPESTRTSMHAGSVRAGGGVVRVPLRHHRKKDGTVFPVEITANFFELDGRRIMVAAIRDITERRRAEEDRGRLEAQLRQAQKMEAIGHLTGGIAHDFNNILTSILGYIALGEERQADGGDAKLARYLEQAKLSAQRARDLIRQMLTFSRGQRGERKALSLPPILKESVKLLRSTLPATIELETDLGRAVPPFMMDPVQIEQVLLNLCINARDAMGGVGEIKVAVDLVDSDETTCASCRQRVAGRFVELAVHDSGPGIAPEVMERMFEPFFTTKEVGRGSGMGLAMVHGIVHDHRGHIVVDTSPEQGTVFRLRFAVAIGAGAGADAAAPNGDPAVRRRPQLKGRVLVVDDEQMVGEFMAELLGNWGLDVVVKHNPVEAEAWFARNPDGADLVLTDQAMPKLTGLELAARLTAMRPGLPVILYTGYGDNITNADLARCSVRTLMRKPVEPETLLAVLRANLPGTDAEAQAAAEPAADLRPGAPPRTKRASGTGARTRSSPRPRPRKGPARKPTGRRR